MLKKLILALAALALSSAALAHGKKDHHGKHHKHDKRHEHHVVIVHPQPIAVVPAAPVYAAPAVPVYAAPAAYPHPVGNVSINVRLPMY